MHDTIESQVQIVLNDKDTHKHNEKYFAIFKIKNKHYETTKTVIVDGEYKKNELFAFHDEYGKIRDITPNRETPF